MSIIDVMIATLLWDMPIADVKELKTLITNVYHEASGEKHDGMNAVAHVTLNRVDSSRYPSTIYKVVHQNSQFSWTLLGHNKPILIENMTDRRALEEAVVVSAMAYNGMTVDPTGGALHYHNPHKVQPKWKKGATMTARINNHDFFKGVK